MKTFKPPSSYNTGAFLFHFQFKYVLTALRIYMETERGGGAIGRFWRQGRRMRISFGVSGRIIISGVAEMQIDSGGLSIVKQSDNMCFVVVFYFTIANSTRKS